MTFSAARTANGGTREKRKRKKKKKRQTARGFSSSTCKNLSLCERHASISARMKAIGRRPSKRSKRCTWPLRPRGAPILITQTTETLSLWIAVGARARMKSMTMMRPTTSRMRRYDLARYRLWTTKRSRLAMPFGNARVGSLFTRERKSGRLRSLHAKQKPLPTHSTLSGGDLGTSSTMTTTTTWSWTIRIYTLACPTIPDTEACPTISETGVPPARPRSTLRAHTAAQTELVPLPEPRPTRLTTMDKAAQPPLRSRHPPRPAMTSAASRTRRGGAKGLRQRTPSPCEARSDGPGVVRLPKCRMTMARRRARQEQSQISELLRATRRPYTRAPISSSRLRRPPPLRRATDCGPKRPWHLLFHWRGENYRSSSPSSRLSPHLPSITSIPSLRPPPCCASVDPVGLERTGFLQEALRRAVALKRPRLLQQQLSPVFPIEALRFPTCTNLLGIKAALPPFLITSSCPPLSSHTPQTLSIVLIDQQLPYLVI